MPADLRPFLRRGEVHKTLKTDNSREARKRAHLWEAHLSALFAKLRREGHRMTTDQIDTLVARYLGAKFAEIEDNLALDWSHPVDRDARVFSLTERAELLSAQLAHFDYGDALAQAAQLMPTADLEAHRRLARRLIEAELEALSAELVGMRGGILPRPSLVALAVAPQVAPKISPKVSEVIEQYAADRLAAGRWSTKTEQSARLQLRQAAELMGDLPIAEVTKAHMRSLQQTVPRLPSNVTKRYGDKNIRQVLAEIEAEGSTTLSPLSPRSANKFFQNVRSLFNWATEHDYIKQSPASVLKDVDEGRAQDARAALEDEDLKLFFPYLEKKGTETELWIARILAYSGMRLAEAAMLRKADIREEQGVWLFDVNEQGEGKRVKTDSSVRKVPVHPRLIQLGLLEVVAKVPEGHLWPDLWAHPSTKHYGPGHNLSKTLMRRLRGSGVADERKVMHSFRHTVATRLKARSVPTYQIAEILGHENDNITVDRYGKQVQPNKLLEVLALLHLPV